MDIFALDNMDEDDLNERINIDDLYEKKRLQDLNKLTIFKKVLGQAHKKIKVASNQKNNSISCWFLVPEHILGVSRFDNPGCIAYLMTNLEKNKFLVKYYHPNAIYISWHHWMPAYIRDEVKKRYGIAVDEFGQQIEEENEEDENNDIRETQKQKNTATLKSGLKKTYTPIDTYRQMGNLAYKQSMSASSEN